MYQHIFLQNSYSINGKWRWLRCVFRTADEQPTMTAWTFNLFVTFCVKSIFDLNRSTAAYSHQPYYEDGYILSNWTQTHTYRHTIQFNLYYYSTIDKFVKTIQNHIARIKWIVNELGQIIWHLINPPIWNHLSKDKLKCFRIDFEYWAFDAKNKINVTTINFIQTCNRIRNRK